MIVKLGHVVFLVSVHLLRARTELVEPVVSLMWLGRDHVNLRYGTSMGCYLNTWLESAQEQHNLHPLLYLAKTAEKRRLLYFWKLAAYSIFPHRCLW